MITVNNVQLRNLQEQVLQNQTDIRYLLNEGGVLNEFGIRVVGKVDTVGELPDPATYGGEFGDAFAVGTETPYTLYIWTRAFSGTTSSFWFNIGVFPAPGTVPGPIGPQGLQGPQGMRGSFWYSQTGAPTITQGVNENDQALDGSTGNVYQFVEGQWQLTGNIRGPQGVQGIQGIIGPIGPAGPIGPQGPQGEQGQFIQILGTLTDVNQLPAPDSVPRYAAYLVPVQGTEHVYLLVGQGTPESPVVWHDAGGFGGGTDVTVDGAPQSIVEVSHIPKIGVSYKTGQDTTVTTNGSKVTFTNMQTAGYNVNNGQIEGMGTIELPFASTGQVKFSAKNKTIEANLAPETWQEIENKVAEAQPEEVQITAPTTATSGQLTQEQLNILQANKGAYLMFNNEIYRLQDAQNPAGYLVYSHLGHQNTNNVYNIKCITVTISTRGWVLVTRQVIDPIALNTCVSKTATGVQTMAGRLYGGAGLATNKLVTKNVSTDADNVWFEPNSNGYEMNYHTFANGIHMEGQGGASSASKKTYLQLPNSNGTERNTVLPNYDGTLVANMSENSGSGMSTRCVNWVSGSNAHLYYLGRLPAINGANNSSIVFSGAVGGVDADKILPVLFTLSSRGNFTCNAFYNVSVTDDYFVIRAKENTDGSYDVYIRLDINSVCSGVFNFLGVTNIMTSNNPVSQPPDLISPRYNLYNIPKMSLSGTTLEITG